MPVLRILLRTSGNFFVPSLINKCNKTFDTHSFFTCMMILSFLNIILSSINTLHSRGTCYQTHGQPATRFQRPPMGADSTNRHNPTANPRTQHTGHPDSGPHPIFVKDELQNGATAIPQPSLLEAWTPAYHYYPRSPRDHAAPAPPSALAREKAT